MPPRRRQAQARDLRHLPDWAVLDEHEAADMTSLSPDTLRRLGLPRTQLSRRRVGYTVGVIRKHVGDTS